MPKKSEWKLDILIDAGNQKFKITSDRYNYILTNWYFNTKKKEWMAGNDSSFYVNLESLMAQVYGLKIRASDVKTLNELQQVMIRSRDEIKGIYGDINIKEL